VWGYPDKRFKQSNCSGQKTQLFDSKKLIVRVKKFNCLIQTVEYFLHASLTPPNDANDPINLMPNLAHMIQTA